MVALLEVGEEADGEDQRHEADEPVADVRRREGVDGADQAGAGQQRAQQGKQEGGEDEPDVPGLHHAALLLHHDGVQKGGASKPGHKARVLDRVPAPVAAPAEDRVGPVRTKKDAAGQEHPGDHGPAAGDRDPLLAGVAHHQRPERKGERHRKSDVAEIEHRRMDDHLRILQQGIETKAVGGERAGLERKRGRGEDQQQQKEDLDGGEDGGRVGGEAYVYLVADAQHKAIGGQQPAPEQQRAFLPGPKRGELISSGKLAVGVVENVAEGVIVGKRGVDQREGGAGDGEESTNAGPAGGLLQARGLRERGGSSKLMP